MILSDEMKRKFLQATPAPDSGLSLYDDVVNATIAVCLDLCDFDIGVLDKADQDSLFSVAIDHWREWPNSYSQEFEQAVADRLRSVAVAGGFDEYLG